MKYRFLITAFFLSIGLSPSLLAIDFGNRAMLQFYPYEEWSVTNPSWTGNPFDLIATVTFTHTGGATHTTEMFYDGGNLWKWRFSASLTGNWSFTTSSSETGLDGHTGTLTVSVNPNVKGYLTAVGPGNDKWGWSTTGDAFTPQYVMYFEEVVPYFNNTIQIDADIQEFVVEHGFSGFILSGIAGRWFDYDKATAEVDNNAENPDPNTFSAVEDVITRTYLAGGSTHLWMWGDQQRGQTPINITTVEGGINGTADRRLQRYLAARLGAIPGWSMGYGFDLQEWVNLPQLEDWRNYVQSQMGWFHFLGGRFGGPTTGTNHTPGIAWNTAMEYSSWQHHKPAYSTLVGAMQAVSGHPSFTEDRFRIRNSTRVKDFAQDGSDTRQYLWRTAIVGGMAAIWGNLWNVGNGGKSDPYPNKTQIKTYSTFWNDNNRLLPGMERANGLTTDPNTRILKTLDNQNFVAYRENATTIQIDLSAAPMPLQVVAVNTLNAYQEINLGVLPAASQVITLPENADWALAIGSTTITSCPSPNGNCFGVQVQIN
ncbi:MAG: DUF5060 domain-containing protein [Phaeodactylibacter sp.]|nr:DUF5060 domain-containing protein [Phaeodactylibacter sp.]